MRLAEAQDVEKLVELMAAFYEESGYALDRPRAGAAFAALLNDPRLGRIWLIQQGSADVAPGSADVGYVVVTFVFAMEYGGIMAIVDDFFIRPTSRGMGLGTATLAEVRTFCSGLGVRAMTVEVGPENAVAQSVYCHAGFEKTDRQLMTLCLTAIDVSSPRSLL
ncbi:MAG: N-acetyltransferase family protein [Thermoleophilia bacterium]